jgi:hypothetical protein
MDACLFPGVRAAREGRVSARYPLIKHFEPIPSKIIEKHLNFVREHAIQAGCHRRSFCGAVPKDVADCRSVSVAQ